jgi:chromate transporter
VHNSEDGPAVPTPSVPFREALRFWVKLGFISFGGPAGQVAIMHRELVEQRKWLGEQRFLHALNFCVLLPGPEAQQLATYIGWLLHRTPGALVAGISFVLPSAVLLFGLSWAYAAWGATAIVRGVVDGFKPVVLAIVIEAVIKIGRRALLRPVHWVIAGVAFLAIAFGHVPFPLIVVLAAGLGAIGGRVAPAVFGASGAGKDVQPTDDAVLPDSAPAPAHTRPSIARLVRVVAVALACWMVPWLALVAARGADSLLAALYRFFTVAAFVTFGGAYSVLAYVTQAAVHQYGWLTPGQAMDGLALAETTPGPLIMVLQFVGFMAGWQRPEGLTPLSSAMIAAAVTTWATFLPSITFILVGGPYVEQLRANRAIRVALTAITAAVVGVVLHLATQFGAAAVWPEGFAAPPNWAALVGAAGAYLALTRWHVDVPWVVLAGGVIGAVAGALR